jgi:hypothetical protein
LLLLKLKVPSDYICGKREKYSDDFFTIEIVKEIGGNKGQNIPPFSGPFAQPQ